MIRFRTLGPPDLRTEDDDRRLLSVLAQPSRVALLAYLLSEGRQAPLRRERLLPLFWPDATPDRARNALNQALHVLRRALCQEAIVSLEGDRLRVDPSKIDCDAVQLQALLASGDTRGALELYGGDFLEGYGPSGPLGRWIDGERTRLRRLAATSAMRLAETLAAEGNLVDATYRARQAVGWAPADEAAARCLMRLQTEAGEPAAALRTYDALAERLAREVDDEPVVETRRLAASIREQAEAPSPATIPQPVPNRSSEPTPGTAPPAPRVVVRARRRLRATVTVAALAGLISLGWLGWLGSSPDDPGDAVAEISRSRVLVAPLVGEPEEPGRTRLGRIAAERIAAELVRSGIVQVVSPSEVLRLRDEPAPDVVALEVARRAGAGLLVSGTIHAERDSLLWEARVVKVAGGNLLHVIEFRSPAAEDPRHAVDRLQRGVAGMLAGQLDENISRFAAHAPPPPDLEVYRHFSDGMRLFGAGQFPAAAARFAAAVEDTIYAPAVLWAAWAHLSDYFATHAIHEEKRARADSLLMLLESRRSRLSPWEAAMLDHHRATSRFEYAAAHEALGAALRYGHDQPWILRRVELATLLDRPREVLRMLTAMDSATDWLASHEKRYWGMKGRALHRLGRYEHELEVAERRLAADPLDASAAWMQLRAFAGLGKRDRVEDWISLSGSRPALIGELRAHGFDDLADSLITVNLAELDAVPPTSHVEEWRYERGLALMGLDRLEEAKSLFEGIGPDQPRHLDALGELGVIYARQGQSRKAADASAALERIEEEAWRLTQQARIAAALGDRDGAIRLLRRLPIQGYLHPEIEFASLRDYPPYEELLRPRG